MRLTRFSFALLAKIAKNLMKNENSPRLKNIGEQKKRRHTKSENAQAKDECMNENYKKKQIYIY